MIKILHTFSLRARLILVYVFILGVGGIITSFIGSLIVESTIMNQARSKVKHDLKTAHMVYNNQLLLIKQAINMGATGNRIRQYLYNNERERLINRLEQIRLDVEIDFMTVTDANGRVILRLTQPDNIGDDVSNIQVIKAALSGKTAAGTEILTKQMLINEDQKFANQAHFRLIDTPRAKPTEKTEETSGMALMVASPIFDNNGKILGVLYGGHLLNRNFKIVDRVWELVYKGEKYRDQNVGTVTIFQNDLRISTNVRTDEGKRALGTRVSEEVYDAVLTRGEIWSARAFVVNDWYISEYEPIKNLNDEIIGILYVGVLEKAYVSTRNNVITTFMLIASIGFIMIVGISYLMTRSITKPLSEMVEVTKSIAMGDLNREVKIVSKDEIGELAFSFNKMLGSLKKMHAELEEWGKTLEQKVKSRTEELGAMQNTLMQSQRLAALGKLAAGIAHEINNPLGGILVLSSLVLEDLKEDDPHRENLQEVIKQTMRCRDIVKGLLQFSRQEKGKTEYVNVNDVLNSTLSLIEKQAMFHDIDVIKNFEQDLPMILGDQSQLQQVLINIILNAVQAMKEIGKLTIDTYHDNKNDMVVIDVNDNGCGIPEDALDRIFDPFFTTKEVGEGTGLGLAIAYGIVTKYQGRMTVKSKVEEGTTFTIKIPVVDK